MFLCTFGNVLFLVVTLCNGFTVAAKSRIVNGFKALPGQFPYQVSLRNTSKSHFCGGSIINTRWVLTAAHCVNGKLPSSILVVAGTNTLLPGGVVYTVSNVATHHLYNSTTLNYDVAVLKTTMVITVNDLIKPIMLASVLPTNGSIGTVSGWGLTVYPSKVIPNDLQALTTFYISKTDCEKRLLEAIPDTNICSFKPCSGICFGDSGGPFVVNGTQIGIASWVYPCGKNKPDAYTNVVSVLPWITNTTRLI